MLPVSHQAVVSQQSAVLSIEWVLRIHFSVKTPVIECSIAAETWVRFWLNQANQGATETMTWEVTHAALDLSVIVLLGQVPLTLVQERGSPADDQNSSATVSASYDL